MRSMVEGAATRADLPTACTCDSPALVGRVVELASPSELAELGWGEFDRGPSGRPNPPISYFLPRSRLAKPRPPA